MDRLKQIWRTRDRPHGAVWLPVWPPLGAFSELALLIGGIYAIDVMLPGIDVASLEPSPYWIPILLLSLQYGTVAGLLAAGAATLVYALGGLPEQAIEENHFAYLLRVWAMPILWIGVALVLGQFRLRQIEIKQRLTARLASATAESEGLARYATNLEERCRELERQITTGASADGGGVLDALAAFHDPRVTLTEAMSALARRAFPEASITAYLLAPWGFEYVAEASEATRTGQRVIDATHPLYEAVAGERRAVSVLQKGDERRLAGDGLAAVPVFQAETGRVIGMLKLDGTSGRAIDEKTVHRLAMLARFVSPLLSEPRVVVDNTEKGPEAGEGLMKRLTRGWRQYSWAALPGHEKTASEAAHSDAGASGQRPRVSK